MNHNGKKDRKGFTLVEILIVIIIIFLVTVMGINTYQSQREFTRYNDAILNINKLIKSARNYTLSSRTVYDPEKIDESTYIPKGGYGVYIEQSNTAGESRFILFANTATGNTPEEDLLKKSQYDEGEDMIEEIYKLDPIVNFEGLFKDEENPPTPIENNENRAVIIFKPPLADSNLAINDNPNPGELKPLSELYLQFRRLGADVAIPPLHIYLNGVSGISEVQKNS